MKALMAILILLLSVAAYSSELSSAAALMQPRAFRPIINSTGLVDGIFRVGGNLECIFPFANSAAWDPYREELLFIGAPHQHPWVYGFPVYSAATNSWRSGNQTPYFAPTAQFNTHSYDNVTTNTRTGEMIIFFGKFMKYNSAEDTLIDIVAQNQGLFDANRSGNWGYYSGIKYFADLNSIVYYNDSRVMMLSLDSMKWQVVTTSLSFGALHNEGAYDPVHHVVYLGGGDGNLRTLYKMDTLLQFTPIAAPPIDISVTLSLLACDPVTGDLLALNKDSLYAYHYETNSWASVVKNPIFNFDPSYAVVTPISNYGILGFMTNYSWPILLYKHATPAAVEKKSDSIRPGSIHSLTCSPNPLNASAIISFNTPASGSASIAILNCRGQTERTFSPGRGTSSVHWDGCDAQGKAVPAGLYMARVSGSSGQFMTTRIMVVR